MEKKKHICICGREIKLTYNLMNNKKSYPHKCPHGVWCNRGKRYIGEHTNYVGCKICDDAENQITLREEKRKTETIQFRKWNYLK